METAIRDLEKRLKKLEIEKKAIQEEIKEIKDKKEKKIEFIEGMEVLYCGDTSNEKFNKKSHIVGITKKCVWIFDEYAPNQRVRRNKSKIKIKKR